LDQKLVSLYKVYRAARASRDSERDNFRGDKAIGDVDSGLEALGKLNLFTEEEETQEKEGDTDW
jgi:hypothetical protein